MSSGQTTLGELSGEETQTEDATPGVRPRETPLLPPVLDDEEEVDEADDAYRPTSPGGPWICDTCKEITECSYRCSECETDLAGVKLTHA